MLQELCEKQEIQMRELQKTLSDTTAESRQTQEQLEQQLQELEHMRSNIKSKSQTNDFSLTSLKCSRPPLIAMKHVTLRNSKFMFTHNPSTGCRHVSESIQDAQQSAYTRASTAPSPSHGGYVSTPAASVTSRDDGTAPTTRDAWSPRSSSR